MALFDRLRLVKGFSTGEPLFMIASEAVKEEAMKVVSKFSRPTPHEPQALHLHVKRNGEIIYKEGTITKKDPIM